MRSQRSTPARAARGGGGLGGPKGPRQRGGGGGGFFVWGGEPPPFVYTNPPLRRLGGKDIPIPYNRGLEKIAIPQEDDIEHEIRAMVEGRI